MAVPQARHWCQVVAGSAVHPHGLNMSGRWVGLGYDDQIMTGFAVMAHSREESEETMAQLVHSGGEVTRGTE